MAMHNKIRLMREVRQWSQEEMAHKMNMSLSGYAKIERGETKLHYDKLVQIARIFNMNLADLIDIDKGVIFCMNENSDYIYTNYGNMSESSLIEIEKLKLTLAHKNELLIQKEKEIQSLKKIITLLETSK
ncbi:helix-turn-helix domain-containing protein [Histophilus somni]|uniref:XRE family transcriptional regulator n=2 Tax=Histophilus somni TaxID=731 RepID=A0AAX2S3W5_HISSO|nr:helix-turn-helix transcriptional regulator [Histophilus somni]ACA30794.1 helix-turn-helix domain protein [Histophilus somni 2336]QEH08628.1 helix-turn-helix transcriptional regulator [Histophilus somni]QEH12791.1 helix-turn-helix transcriptional regulator [Histophilus somni]QEH17700.1 helix-turn-helix transcriptional regulator [Histophilus somni]QEH24897.1 helix-turn-helix transcriptional regulator [Histophilus somni]